MKWNALRWCPSLGHHNLTCGGYYLIYLLKFVPPRKRTNNNFKFFWVEIHIQKWSWWFKIVFAFLCYLKFVSILRKIQWLFWNENDLVCGTYENKRTISKISTGDEKFCFQINTKRDLRIDFKVGVSSFVQVIFCFFIGRACVYIAWNDWALLASNFNWGSFHLF